MLLGFARRDGRGARRSSRGRSRDGADLVKCACVPVAFGTARRLPVRVRPPAGGRDRARAGGRGWCRCRRDPTREARRRDRDRDRVERRAARSRCTTSASITASTTRSRAGSTRCASSPAGAASTSSSTRSAARCSRAASRASPTADAASPSAARAATSNRSTCACSALGNQSITGVFLGAEIIDAARPGDDPGPRRRRRRGPPRSRRRPHVPADAKRRPRTPTSRAARPSAAWCSFPERRRQHRRAPRTRAVLARSASSPARNVRGPRRPVRPSAVDVASLGSPSTSVSVLSIGTHFDGSRSVPTTVKPHVAPRAEALRREVVDARVAGRGRRARAAASRRAPAGRDARGARRPSTRRPRRVGRAREREELVDLVRADVDEDAAVALRVEEPLGPVLQVQRVRTEPDRVHDRRRCAAAHELSAPRSSPGLPSRSPNTTSQRRPVSACTARTSSSCSAVVTPGLSSTTSLPACIASIAIAGPVARDRRGHDDVDVVGVRIGRCGRRDTATRATARCRRRSRRPRAPSRAGVDELLRQLDDVRVIGPDDGDSRHVDCTGWRVFSSRALSRMMRCWSASSNCLTSTA